MSRKIDTNTLLKKMLAAAARVLQERWPTAKDYAEIEFRKLLIQADHIKRLKSKKKITRDEATCLMDLQRSAMRSVLLTLEGLGILTVGTVIHAALSAVGDAVKTAVGGGWKIL